MSVLLLDSSCYLSHSVLFPIPTLLLWESIAKYLCIIIYDATILVVFLSKDVFNSLMHFHAQIEAK